MDPGTDITKEDILESISEWPVDHNQDLYVSATDKIHNPSSVSSFFLRNVGKAKKVTEKPVYDEPEEDLADVALAKWWRKAGKSMVSPENVPDSNNPNTIVQYIARSEKGVDFIRAEISRLRDKISKGCKSANISSVLSSYYEKLGNLSLAKLHLESALEKQPNDKELKWRLERLKRAIHWRQLQEDALSQLNHTSDSVLTLPKHKQVERVHVDKLSFREFFYNYALKSKPVVITGLTNQMVSEPWTFQYISHIAGECSATLKKCIKESVEWARLEDSSKMKIKDFIHSIHDDSHDHEKMYLFDWSIPLHCPELAKELTIPKYFAGDFLQRTTQGSLYKDSWPSLFIAPEGLTSELHVDAFGSNFWMALFQGRKRWVFYGKEDVPMLYPVYGQPWSTDPVFEVDLQNPDLKQHPLLSLAKPVECILQPGELLFVPAGCPHRVENLETSLAISGNFVDLSNIDLVKGELTLNGLLEERSAELLKQLDNSEFKCTCTMNSDIEHLTWDKFKSWSPDNYDTFDISPQIVDDKRDKIYNT